MKFLHRSWNILFQHLQKAFRALLILFIFTTLLLTSTLHAIHDTNQNGVSDLWEEKFNSGAPFNTFDPLADPDADGWTHAQEALAGTDPFSANPLTGHIRPKLTHTQAVYLNPATPGAPPTLITPAAITLTYPTVAGKRYTVLYSSDLTPASWSPLGTPVTGAGTELGTGLTLTQPDGTTPPKIFLKVTIADQDTDNDTLTDSEEHQLGSSPNFADTDGDGLSDKQEAEFGTSPNSSDTDSDGIFDAEEIASGHDSKSNQSYPPRLNIALRTTMTDPNLHLGYLESNWPPYYYSQILYDPPFMPAASVLAWAATMPFPDQAPENLLPTYGRLLGEVHLSYTLIRAAYGDLTQGRYWLQTKPASNVEIKRTFLKITTGFRRPTVGSVDEELFPPIVEKLEMTIPANSNASPHIDIIPPLNISIGTNIIIANEVSLLPVEVEDIKDSAKADDDVTITPWNSATQPNPTDENIAWIEPHKSATDAAPRMPQLVLNIPGLPQNVTLDAKLIVVYERPYAGKQADDTVKIPEDGSFQSVANGRWEIFAHYTNIPFFGGDATLTYKVNGGAEQTIKFAIGGRNPDDSRCKTYTQGRPAAPWYSYAIEKHESESYNPGFYNQFWERHGNSSPVNNGVNYTFTKGDALIVRSSGETGVGGTGLAQVTGAGGNKTVSAPREIFWNWQKNVDAFLVIMAAKIQIAETFMNDPTLRNGPGSMPNGQRPQTTFHTGNNVAVPSKVQGLVSFGDALNNKRPEDAVAIKAYNGASSHWCSWRGPTVHEWQFNYGQNNYVQEVCNEIEEAQP